MNLEESKALALARGKDAREKAKKSIKRTGGWILVLVGIVFSILFLYEGKKEYMRDRVEVARSRFPPLPVSCEGPPLPLGVTQVLAGAGGMWSPPLVLAGRNAIFTEEIDGMDVYFLIWTRDGKRKGPLPYKTERGNYPKWGEAWCIRLYAPYATELPVTIKGEQ